MSNTEEEIRNNFTLIFDSDRKKLKLKDQKGYSYNIAFEDKSNKSNDDISSINLKKFFLIIFCFYTNYFFSIKMIDQLYCQFFC